MRYGRLSNGLLTRVLPSHQRFLRTQQQKPPIFLSDVQRHRYSDACEVPRLEDLPQFQWSTPLKKGHIRLFQFLPSPKSGLLRCRVFDHSLSDKLEYNALSYAWGETATPRRLICNRQQLPITANLHSALRQLHSEGMREPLWVDAVCINQKDNIEKTEQVRKMGDVFRNASKVVVWLGDERPGEEEAWDMLNHVEKKILNAAEVEEPGADDIDSVPGRLNTRWAALGSLLNRPWFTRIWIVQELLLAKRIEIRSGPLKIPWESISRLVRAMHRAPNLRVTLRVWDVISAEVSSCLHRLVRWRDRGVEQLRYSLDGLLQRTVAFQMSDPRDRFFALAALMEKDSAKLVDYRKDWNTVRVQVARRLLNLSDDDELSGRSSLRVLAYCDSSARDASLPSWVPAWGSGSVASTPLVRFSMKTEMAPRGQCDENNHLIIAGTFFDTIQSLHRPYQHSYSTVKFVTNRQMKFRLAREEIEFCEAHADFLAQTFSLVTGSDVRVAPVHDDVVECYWRTLCFNQHLRHTHLDLGEGLREEFETWRDWVTVCGSMAAKTANDMELSWQKLATASPCWDTIRTRGWYVSESILGRRDTSIGEHHLHLSTRGFKFRDAFHRLAYGRKFSKTARGFVGWVPAAAEAGDELCLFRGESLPFVVRRRQDGEGYSLIGACYMHGLMNEEALGLTGTRDEMIKLV